MPIPVAHTVVSHPEVPSVLSYTLPPIDRGNHYVHGLDLGKLIREVFKWGFSPANMGIYFNEGYNANAIYGLERTHDHLVIQITRGIFRAVVITPDGEVAAFEEEDGHGTSIKLGLRPTRGLIVPNGFAYALQALTPGHSFTIFRPRISNSPDDLNPTEEPIKGWINAYSIGGRPTYPSKAKP